MNVFFMIDIIVNFFSAFYETDLKIIDDYKVQFYYLIPLKLIAVRYLKGWFILDVMTVLPFDIIFEYGNISRIARLSRIGRI